MLKSNPIITNFTIYFSTPLKFKVEGSSNHPSMNNVVEMFVGDVECL
jgi:hypothetical protein